MKQKEKETPAGNGAPEWVVRLEDAGKRYVKYLDVPLLLTRLRFRAGSRREHLWAVRHVDLQVEGGETVGVIGRNGSGKSTMLRMLAGVTAPTEGAVAVRGRVAPLLSVGVGFHPELTGRENVYVNGIIFGLARRQVDRLFDSIVSFAELEGFVDTPVKFYSSGMLVRLGFAAAVAVRPDVLLVDEVLAVGDLAFQAKCFDRMEEMKADGTSILVVSHNLNAIRRACSRVMVLHGGEVRFLGDTNQAISAYHDLLGGMSDEEGGTTSAGVEMRAFELLGNNGAPTGHVEAGDEIVFRLEASFSDRVRDPIFGLGIATETGQPVYTETTYGRATGSFASGQRARCDIRLPARLTTGSYLARAWVGRGEENEIYARARPILFFVGGRPMVRGIADLNGSFDVTRIAEDTPARVRGTAADDSSGGPRS